MINFEAGAKTTGRKFYFTTGEDAMNEWEYLTYMINYHISRGYEFVIPPYLVTKETAGWAGIWPRFEGQFYETKDGHILIPTAETPLVGLHANEIIPEDKLPLKYVAFSPCFRKEAGASGQRDAGLKRVHQFHKVELFVICKPEDSERIHEEMRQQVEDLMKIFGVNHRVVELDEHDRSPVSAKTYDIELEYGDEWLEVSSISNTLDRQSKLAQIRYRPTKGGKPIKCHLLNGSGVAWPRLALALGAKT